MRRQFLGALLFAGTLAFTACQNETVIYLDENGNPIENVELKEGEGLLKINLSNTSENSRAVRPVGSSAAANNVNVVKIYAFKYDGVSDYKFDDKVDVSTEETADGIIVISDFIAKDEHSNPTESWENHTDQTKTIKLTGLAENSKYKFVAVGYNVADPKSNTENPYGEPNLTAESTTLKYFTTTALASEKTDYDIEELFAGVSAECVTTDKVTFSTPATVTLTRQVAGMLGYFDNVPTKIDGSVVKYVRVYANDEYTQFKWPAQLLETPDFNGDTKQTTVGSDNGESTTGTNGKFLLMEFDMSKIATNWNGTAVEQTATSYTFSSFGDAGATGTETAGNQIGSTDGSKAPLATGYTAPAGLKLVQNSIFGGRYIIPYAGHVDSQTLTVELQDTDGTALKTLKVTTNNAPSGVTDGTYQYDIRCNNFYSIGKKLYTDNTGGDPDPDPTPENPDPDEPIDLSSNTNIVVIINDAWEVLHNMGVEE